MKSAPPSIPSPGQAFGYEEGKDGRLQKQNAPKKDSSLGPAFYKIDYVSDLFYLRFLRTDNPVWDGKCWLFVCVYS